MLLFVLRFYTKGPSLTNISYRCFHTQDKKKYVQNSMSDKYNAPGTLDILSDGGTNTYTYLQSPSTQPLLCYTRGCYEDVAIAETICLFGSVS